MALEGELEKSMWHKYGTNSIMIQAYLIVNSAFYLLFSIWCIVKPESTAKFLGYDFFNNSGKVEFLTIYTGLELGITAFLFISAMFEQMRFSGLVFCVSIYIGVMIIRPISALVYGNVNKATYIVGALEWILGIWGIVLLFQYKNNSL